MKIWALVRPYVVILFATAVVVSSIALNKTPLFGVDGYFHYNRIFEAAMQIKKHHFSFINLYSFQQSGRIVNQVYSPLFGYVFGALLLAAGNWFKFQIISLILLMFVAGMSMYITAKHLRLPENISLALGIIYLTVGSISTFVFTVGWKAIGLAFLPLLVIAMSNMLTQRWQTKSAVLLGVLVSLQMQGHPLSVLFILPALVPFFVAGFLKAQQKSLAVKFLITSIVVAIILSLNVALPYFELMQNTVVPPIKIDVTANLINPFNLFGGGASVSDNILAILVFAGITGALLYWRKLSFTAKTLLIIGVVYFILGSNLTPWPAIQNHWPSVQSYLQFPFRFTMVGEAFVLLGATLMLYEIRIPLPVFTFSAVLLAVMSVISLATSVSSQVIVNRNPATTIAAGTNISSRILIRHRNEAGKIVTAMPDLQDAWHSSDLSEFIRIVDRTTPDYIPVSKLNSNMTYYGAYTKDVSLANEHVVKRILPDGTMLISWHQDKRGTHQVPVFAYQHTKLVLNGHQVSEKSIRRAKSGVVQLIGVGGKNSLHLSYQVNPVIKWGVLLTYVAWLIVMSYVGVNLFKKFSELALKTNNH